MFDDQHQSIVQAVEHYLDMLRPFRGVPELRLSYQPYKNEPESYKSQPEACYEWCVYQEVKKCIENDQWDHVAM